MSGANLRTRSNVWFGEPTLGERFYDTTTGKTFVPKSVPYTYNRENIMQKSVVPLDYYSKCPAKRFAVRFLVMTAVVKLSVKVGVG